MSDLLSRLSSLRYFKRRNLPRLSTDYDELDLSHEHGCEIALKRFGISVDAPRPGNMLLAHREATRLRFPTPLHFRGEHNTIIIDSSCGYHGSLTFEADGNLVVLLGGQGELALDATLYAGDTLVSGKGVDAWGVRVWVQGGTVCTISDDCLLSENITIRTTDHHSIIDLTTWAQLNCPADVTIGQHVWIGPNCAIIKGAEIGDGAIVAPNSLVNSSIPRTELWGGYPARMLRKNVSWVVSHPTADPNEIKALRGLFG